MTQVEMVEEAIQLAEGFGYDARSYSGRGMYGNECVGFRLDSGEDYSEVLFAIIEGWYSRYGDIEIMEELKGFETDNIGLGTILYFPHWPWTEKDDNAFGFDDEEADEDEDDE